MNDPELMTVKEFNDLVLKWGLKIRQQAKTTLRWRTNASGNLAKSLIQFGDKHSDNSPVYKIKFWFEKYGVYRAYGAGRGYVIVNGVPVRGYRIRSDREIEQGSFGLAAGQYFKKGFSSKEVNRLKRVNTFDKRRARSGLDWIDQFVQGGVYELADYVQEFYGDDAMREVLRVMPKNMIVK